MWRPRTPMIQRLISGCALERACRLFLLVALVCALSACGGGGASDGDDDAPPPDGDSGLPPVDDGLPPAGDDGAPPPGSDNGPPPADDRLPPASADVVDPTEVASGGGNTVTLGNEDAFSKSNPQLGLLDQGKFESGDSEFERPRQGLLGPLFNNGTCEGCHKKDGRGNPPRDTNDDGETDQHMESMLVRLSIPVMDPTAPVVVSGGVQPEPVYGGQIQVRGGSGTPGEPSVHNGALLLDGTPSDDPEDAIGEAFVSILYESLSGQYADGTPYYLQQPTYRLYDLAYGPFCADEPDCHDDEVQFSPRVAPQAFGLGLLEAIPEDDLLSYADPRDADGDGISGRPNRVWDVWTQTPGHLGRFGHKASKPTLLHQLAAAYVGDIGLTSSLFPDHTCTVYQPACEALAEEQSAADVAVEIDDLTLALVEFYMRQLAVPQRRGWDEDAQAWEPQIWRGRQLFFEAGCVACHVPRHVTGDAGGSVLGQITDTLDELSGPAAPLPSLSNQVIWPFTDLLLHDMGGSCEPVVREDENGDLCTDEGAASCLWVQRCDGLADGRPDFGASGSEWRTPPLWGLGLVKVVNPDAGLLHDGRAGSTANRTIKEAIEEAILWHGGEAEAAKEHFRHLPHADREALLTFLESL